MPTDPKGVAATFREKTAERVKATGRRAYRPSNGTEGDIFMREFCHRCTKDNPETEDYCPIIARTMCFDVDDENYPGQWIYGDDGRPRCTSFERDWSAE